MSKKDESYFDRAVANLEGHMLSQQSLRLDQVALAVDAVLLSVRPADEVIVKLDDFQRDCTRHADLSKI